MGCYGDVTWQDPTWDLLTTLSIYSINFHWHPLVTTFKVAPD